ncbi:MAG: TetR family transcriptional regulator C-terminal domain-containing protein [Lachnospiraceae bacterium]|nr:TetR family transcriptional regulator C-terminal domain-containing protein [Lachnospiraceae bacterium]
MEKRENRRVKMTKRLLTESILSFLEEKPLHKITVKEICEKADVNRSTYYAYYADPYDQINKMEDEIMMDMSVYVDSIELNGQSSKKKHIQVTKTILSYIQSKKEIFKVLLGEYGDANFEKNLLRFFGERIFGNENMDNRNALKKAYQYIYAATGSFGLIQRWLMDEEDVDIDTMAQWIAEMNMPLL